MDPGEVVGGVFHDVFFKWLIGVRKEKARLCDQAGSVLFVELSVVIIANYKCGTWD